MSKHYDIAIVGSSLAAQISAALLVKQGGRVLFLSETGMKDPTWFHSSLFLENNIGILGGRSCFMAQRPIQIVSENSRLTVSNDISLDKELQREFGASGPAISDWLAGLQEQGERLEELFLDNGGLLWPSFKAKARFKMLCVRNRVNLSVLERPIADQLSGFADLPRAFLTDLLQGLALTPVDNLSTARAAIFRMDSPVSPETTKRLSPSGGVMKPTPSAVIIMMQNWISFMPMLSASGLRIGARRRCSMSSETPSRTASRQHRTNYASGTKRGPDAPRWARWNPKTTPVTASRWPID